MHFPWGPMQRDACLVSGARCRVLEAVWRADRQYGVADPGVVGIAKSDHWQIAGVDLQHGDIGELVDPDHLGDEFAPVGQLGDHFLGAGDHLGVSQGGTVGADDEARVESMRDIVVRCVRLLLARKAAKKLRQRVARIGLVFVPARLAVGTWRDLPVTLMLTTAGPNC